MQLNLSPKMSLKKSNDIAQFFKKRRRVGSTFTYRKTMTLKCWFNIKKYYYAQRNFL